MRNAAQKAAPLGKTKYNHASGIITKKGKLISLGVNHFAGKIEKTEDGDIESTVHSEVHALTKVNIRRLSGAIIINYACAASKYGNAVVARPCGNCWPILKKLGFLKVFYTIHSPRMEPLWKEEKF